MGPSLDRRQFLLSKEKLGAILLLVASGSAFLLIFSPQITWAFSTEVEGRKISSVTGSFGFTENPTEPSLSEPAKAAPPDAGWGRFKVKWTILSLPGSIMTIPLLVSGALLLLAAGETLTISVHHRYLTVSASIIASLCLLTMICLLFLGDANNPQKLGLNFFEKEENRVHVDDPYVGYGSGYDVVFRTEPGLGSYLLVLTTLNALLGTFLIWQNDPNSLSSQ